MTNSIAEECVDSRLNSPLDHSVSGSSGSGHDPREFLKVVKEMFHNRRENYLKFLQIMEDYKAHRIEIVSVISEVEKLFKGNQRLILGFNAFLPKGCNIPLPLKDEHTAKNPGHAEAVNFVKKLKARFLGQEEVHASIIQIFNMHRLKQKCTTEVYQEVSTLLEGHADLLEEFTQFLGNNASMRLEQQRRMEEKEKESNMFLGNNASMRLEQQRRMIEKEKESNTGTDRRDVDDSHESDKGLHIQIDIKMHRISHKRKNSDHVDYPASHMSRCGVSPQESHSCKKGNERLDKADTDQEASTCHSISKPILEHNFSACQRCSPSYCLLPKNYQTPASQRTELDASVLNDQCVSVAPKCDDYVSKHRHKNQFEELQLRFEDERFELDLLLSQAIRTTAVVELLKEIHERRPDNPISIEAHFTAQNIRCIEKIYGDHGLDMIEHLRNQPSTVLPVILVRLKQKQEEWRRKRTEFNSVWRETLCGAQQVFLAKH